MFLCCLAGRAPPQTIATLLGAKAPLAAKEYYPPNRSDLIALWTNISQITYWISC